MAYVNNGYDGSTAVNDFSAFDEMSGYRIMDKAYTTDELRELLNEAVSSGVRKYEFKNGTIAYCQGDADTNVQLSVLNSQRDRLQSQLETAKAEQKKDDMS